ncbi:MAG TPA: DUF177 domain-containing protein [Gemmatimonadales bacterium]|nr:DUF177 domain-containing protein [Gemmatimonadales bacterium]
MLEVDLRELARGPVETQGVLAGEDPLFAGVDAAFAEPVRVGGRLQATGAGRFYWHGSLHTVVRAECRRCLAPVAVPVAVEIGALFSQEPGAADDPDTYPVARDALLIDVRAAVREELILALPQYVLCREDCRGLCPRCGKDLNAGPCGCPAPATDSRWLGLAMLRDKFRD